MMNIELDNYEPSNDTYIVSGHPRSGTSMMMKSLIAGGLTGTHMERERIVDAENIEVQEHKYEANPGGFYELGRGSGLSAWFPRQHEGTLIKIIFRGLAGLAPGRYKVVYMLRDPEEIIASMLKIREERGPMRTRRQGWTRPAEYLELMRHFLSLANQRKDMDVLQVWYGDVLSDPVKAFEKVRDFGMPIDPEKAAEIVTPDLYRNRAQNSKSPRTL